MQTLRLQQAQFDPFTRKIILDGPMHVADLADLTREAFLHSELISMKLPVEVLDTEKAVYYLFSWQIEGEILDNDRIDRRHIFIQK